MFSFSKFKANFIPQLLLSYVFLVSGIIVVSLQLLTYLFVWPFDKILYRRLNNYLAYLLYANLTTLAQWWSGSTIEYFLDSENDFKMLGKENALCILNHKYDIDWLIGLMISQNINILGGCKVVMKESLKYIPILGQSWSFNEFIFVKRVWEKDYQSIVKELGTMFNYPKDLHYTISLFCEGTRFNKEKHEASLEIAKAKGLPLLKHHLLPRSKGFTLVTSLLKGKVDTLYDVNIAIKDNPSLMNIKNGVPMQIQIYLRRIPYDQVPLDDENENIKFLFKLYKEKDDIHDVFMKHGDFSALGVQKQIFKKDRKDLYVSIFWLVVILVPSLYYLLLLLWNGTILFKLIFIISSLIIYYGVELMSKTSYSDKSFGLKKNK